MMLGNTNGEDKILVVEPDAQRFTSQPGMSSRPHKDMVMRIDFVSKERKYFSIRYLLYVF